VIISIVLDFDIRLDDSLHQKCSGMERSEIFDNVLRNGRVYLTVLQQDAGQRRSRPTCSIDNKQRSETCF